MTLRILIGQTAYTDTLPLKAAEVAAKLANLSAANTYIDGLANGGTPVTIDATDGTAAVADGVIANTLRYVGLIVNGSLANAQANYHSLANKQITYVKGPALIETDQVVTGVAYAPQDLIYVGTGANKGKLTKDSTGITEAPIGVVKLGRASGSTDLIQIILN